MPVNSKEDIPAVESSNSSVEISQMSEEKKKEVTIQAINLLAQGKRNLLCQEITTAVEQLQLSSKLLASAFGETAKECAEAYLCYGQALLELARVENTVLGNALQGVPSEEEDEGVNCNEQFESTKDLNGDERFELRKTVCEAMDAEEREPTCEETQDTEGKEMAVESTAPSNVAPGEDAREDDDKEEMITDDKASAENKETDKKEESKDEATEPQGDETTQENGGNEDESENEEETDESTEETEEDDENESNEQNPDDVSNFQLSWEMLELARIIFLKSCDDKLKLRAADACMMLGEISLETEQYEKAVEDITHCLTIQQDILECENRLIAETHYQLGLAYLYNLQHHDSLKHLETAVDVIKRKIAKLKNFISENSSRENDLTDLDNPIVKAQIEIKELEDILPEILIKIDDVKDEMKSYDTIKSIIKAKEASSAAAGGFTDVLTSKAAEPEQKEQINNISHLIRKKRKPDEEESEVENKEAKKYCPDPKEVIAMQQSMEESNTKCKVLATGDADSTVQDGEKELPMEQEKIKADTTETV